ncbi:MAG: hypothetical protein ABH877_04225 [bacterium]
MPRLRSPKADHLIDRSDERGCKPIVLEAVLLLVLAFAVGGVIALAGVALN